MTKKRRSTDPITEEADRASNNKRMHGNTGTNDRDGKTCAETGSNRRKKH